MICQTLVYTVPNVDIIYVILFDVNHMRMSDGMNKATTYLLTYFYLIDGIIIQEVDEAILFCINTKEKNLLFFIC